jgi:hypothetical protein
LHSTTVGRYNSRINEAQKKVICNLTWPVLAKDVAEGIGTRTCLGQALKGEHPKQTTRQDIDCLQ